ncbi:hypothetical protein K438DRAFT_1781032 [Mycena galopus ATCC 62051]|nr:hypothetical protein K438DRAFT_1781032 [Mycena galopus ATCC 62051]
MNRFLKKATSYGGHSDIEGHLGACHNSHRATCDYEKCSSCGLSAREGVNREQEEVDVNAFDPTSLPAYTKKDFADHITRMKPIHHSSELTIAFAFNSSTNHRLREVGYNEKPKRIECSRVDGVLHRGLGRKREAVRWHPVRATRYIQADEIFSRKMMKNEESGNRCDTLESSFSKTEDISQGRVED